MRALLLKPLNSSLVSILFFFFAFIPDRTVAAERLMALHSAMSMSQSMPWIAQEAGLFNKHKLDFQLVYISTSVLGTAALLGGDAEVAVSGAGGFVRAFVQGAGEIVFIGGVKNILSHSIVAGPRIKNPEDLKGKRIGVTRIGTNVHYFVIQALRHIGLDPARDVVIRQVGGEFQAIAALANDAIDAAAMLSYGPTAIAQGFHYVLYGPNLRIPYVGGGLITRRSILTKRPQILGRFMRAMAEASVILHTDKEFALKVLGRRLRVADRKIVEALYDSEIKALEQRLEIRPEALQAMLDEVSQTDPRARKVKHQDLVDRRYLDELEKSGFFERIWTGK
ncbi:MAG: ABC transporter substrate-binding protein [Deltaproteobacteria bacterium]|nr:ABC transporter substrate-binding protein [Deltaproteobacteria bacterium]